MKEEELKSFYFFLKDSGYFIDNKKYKEDWDKDKKLFKKEVDSGKIDIYGING